MRMLVLNRPTGNYIVISSRWRGAQLTIAQYTRGLETWSCQTRKLFIFRTRRTRGFPHGLGNLMIEVDKKVASYIKTESVDRRKYSWIKYLRVPFRGWMTSKRDSGGSLLGACYVPWSNDWARPLGTCKADRRVSRVLRDVVDTGRRRSGRVADMLFSVAEMSRDHENENDTSAAVWWETEMAPGHLSWKICFRVPGWPSQ